MPRALATLRNLLPAVFAIVLVLLPAQTVFATTLDYTFSGVGSGTIAGNTNATFTDTAFTVTFVENTASIGGSEGYCLYDPAGDGAFTEGSYTSDITNGIIEVNGNANTGAGSYETVFLFNSDFGSSIGISDDPALLGYTLATPFTTGSESSNIGAFQDATGFTTNTADVVQFTSLSSLDFTAAAPLSSSTPEPSTLALLGIGLFAAGVLRRRSNA
jgi:hypothetical protein